MIDLGLSQAAQAYLTLAIVAGMFVLFMREIFATEVIAIGGAALVLVLGLVPYKDAVAVLSNTAPWTIIMMFLLMGGLVRTGALDWLTRQAERHIDDRPVLAVIGIFVAIAAASAFLNMDKAEPMRRFITGMARDRFTPAGGEATLSGLCVETDDRSGKATRVLAVRVGGRLPPSTPV